MVRIYHAQGGTCSNAVPALKTQDRFRPVRPGPLVHLRGQLLLCSAQDPSEGQAVVEALAGALDGGQLDRAAFNASVQRVTALRTGLR